MILPNFLIIGSSKAATTSLYHYLKAHPDVFMSDVKEVNYFAYSSDDLGFPRAWGKEGHHKFPAKTLEAYAALFEDAGSCNAIGEASPLYLDSPLAPGRIRETIPDARLILSIRNPVDRILSDYKMQARCGFSNESFQEAFQPGKQLRELGFVGPRIETYLKAFDRDQFKILLFDEICQDPQQVMRDLYGFLGVDTQFSPDVEQKYNTDPENRSNRRKTSVRSMLGAAKRRLMGHSRGPRSAPHAAAHLADLAASIEVIREDLLSIYRDDIVRTQELTGRDLSAWLAA